MSEIRPDWRWGEPLHKAAIPGARVATLVNPGTVAQIAGTIGADDVVFGPGRPPAPLHPEYPEARRWDYQPGRNILQTPRAYEGISFAALRQLCDSYDVARIAIESIKREIRGYEWAVRPRSVPGLSREDMRIRTRELLEPMAQVTEWLMSPNGEDDWGTWLSMFLEDLLTLDAGTLYLQPNRGGGFYGADVIDGSTILPMVDDYGRVPAPPSPAYGQVIKGIVWGEYTRDQIVYAPFWQRTYSPYGFPPMEWILLAVSRAVRRQTIDLSRFTEGTLPVAFYRVPKEWSDTQLGELQSIFDKLLAGDDILRSRVRFVPGGEGTGLEEVHPEPTTEVEEWLMTLTAAAFGTNASELGFQPRGQGLGGTGYAEASADSAKRKGTLPLLQHIKRILDLIIVGQLGKPELEFGWLGIGDDADAVQIAQADKLYWEMGALSSDEIRVDRLDRDPIGLEHTLAFPPGGVVKVKDFLIAPPPADQATPEDMKEPGEVPEALKEYAGPGEPPEGPPEQSEEDRQEDATSEAALEAEEEADDDAELTKMALAQFRRKAARALLRGKSPAVAFTSPYLGERVVDTLRYRLTKAATPEDIRSIFEDLRLAAPADPKGKSPDSRENSPPSSRRTSRPRPLIFYDDWAGTRRT